MKTFKQLMSFALALLMLASVIPISVISAKAAPTTSEMMDNYVLDAMEYLGFRMDDFKASGNMYTEEGKTYSPDIRYDDKSWGDKVEGTLRGLETTTDPKTGATVPDKAKIEDYGLVCASYTSYYYLNYLPNVKGKDVSAFKEDMQYWKDKTGLSWQGAWLWRYALEKISADSDGSVTRIYYARYNAKETDKYGNKVGKKPTADDYAKMEVGDIVTFGYEDTLEDGTKKEAFSHVGIYLGEKNSKHWMSHCVPRSYTDSSGKTHNVSIVFGTVEGMYYDGGPKPASIVTGVYRLKDNEHVDKTGMIEIYKKDPNGKVLAGATFKATETATGETYYIGPTDDEGYAYRKDIPFGTYKIVETVFPEGYTTSGEGEWTRTLDESTPNATIKIEAVNKLITGTGKIIKKSTNGGTVEGWWFYIWKVVDGEWNWVGRYKTGEFGTIAVELEPGTYIVREVPLSVYGQEGLTLPLGVDPQYWTQVAADKTMTITANNTTTVTFDNEYCGKIKIQKTTNTGGDLAGWVFEVKDASNKVVATLTTDASGIATSGKLNPGAYTVKEIGGPSGVWGSEDWFFDVTTSGGIIVATAIDTGRTVTVSAGTTAIHNVKNIKGGKIAVQKKTNTGKFLSGWQFEVRDINGKLVITLVTDDSGYAVTPKSLAPGKYTVTEVGNINPDYNPDYWDMDKNPTRTVTICADTYAEVQTEAYDNTHFGFGQIQKVTVTGGTVEGWRFQIWRAEEGKDWEWIGNYGTDAEGRIKLKLLPGRYVVREQKLDTYKSYPLPEGVDPEYWVCDYTDKYITIVAGETTEVAFENRQIGKVEIVKTLTDPSLGTVEGWRFSITNEAGQELGIYTTDAAGIILTDLEPGTYIVTELMDTDSMWECITPNPQTVTVEAGKTATVSFVNAPRTGEIRIYKVNTNNQPLDGVEFLLEWSENGTDWQPVYYCDPDNLQIGGCTSESLKEGRLVSGADGIVVFDGLHPALQYRLTETATKNGYQLLAGYAYQGKLPMDRDLTVSIRVVNAEKFTLPNTGSQSLVLMPMSVLLCLSLCAGAILFLRRKED